MKKTSKGLTFFQFDNMAQYPSLVNAVFSRLGGESTGCYKSLNLGLHVNDDRASVLNNRDMVLNELGFPPDRFIAMEQVHSDNLEVLTRKDGGRGAYSWGDAIPATDGMITGDKGLLLMAVVADCSVSLFYDPQKEVIGISHCGWRGTVKKLAFKTVKTMELKFGSHPSHIITGIAPSIGPDCFEVGQEVLSLFLESFGNAAEDFFQYKGEKIYLDLQKAIVHQLIKGGVKKENIEILNICTSCRTDIFYSHRKEAGKTGRNGVFIGLKE